MGTSEHRHSGGKTQLRGRHLSCLQKTQLRGSTGVCPGCGRPQHDCMQHNYMQHDCVWLCAGCAAECTVHTPAACNICKGRGGHAPVERLGSQCMAGRLSYLHHGLPELVQQYGAVLVLHGILQGRVREVCCQQAPALPAS